MEEEDVDEDVEVVKIFEADEDDHEENEEALEFCKKEE